MAEEKENTRDKREIEAVAKGKISSHPSGLRWLYKTFIATDIRTVAKDAWEDVIVPGIKATIWNGIGSMLGVDIRPSRRRKGDREDYGRYSSEGQSRSRRNRRDDDDDRNSRYDYRDIIFDTKSEAEDVLDRLIELTEEYDQASIADLFDLAGMSRKSQFTDNKWGWGKGDLDDARSRRVSGGYELVLPREKSLE